jgi:putative DNA primase/helicase
MSGIGKSPLLNLCLRPLHAKEQKRRDEYAAAVKEHAAVLEEHKLAMRAWEQQFIAAKKHKPAALDPPPRPDEPPDAPTAKRLVTNDATYAKLHVVMSQNPAGVMLVRDELTGWLSRLDREEYGEERAFALSAWNGDTPHTVDRIERGSVHVPHFCLSVLGGITPDRLRSYLAQAPHNSPTSDGLVQRFGLPVWPEIPTEWTYTDRPPHAAAQRQAIAIYERLTQFDHESPKLYRFSPARRSCLSGGSPASKESSEAKRFRLRSSPT